MADEIDLAAEHEEMHRQQALAQIKPFVLQSGVAGDCEICGEWFGRLIGGACAPCRDKHKLP